MARILVTGATDGLGSDAAADMVQQGHTVFIHGRQADKAARVCDDIGAAGTVVADLSDLSAVAQMAEVAVADGLIDVLVNNAGVFKMSPPRLAHGVDVRFVVNALAPMLLTRSLLAANPALQRVVTLSSAAQAPVDLAALAPGGGSGQLLPDFDAYAQSKLAVTMWNYHASLAADATGGPVYIAVNPASLLGTKMVQEGFGVAGKDPAIGSRIIVQAALDEEFALHSGEYFDNDMGQFNDAHADVYDDQKRAAVMAALEHILQPFVAN